MHSDARMVGGGTSVTFRRFAAGDEEAAIELLSIGRPDGYRALKTQLFDWQFRRCPHDDGRSPFLVGELDGRIVALNGLMPVRARFRGTPIEACWSCDTYVSGEHRGKGIGKQLIAQVTNSAPLMLGYGISAMSDPIFEKQGWRLHPAIEIVFFHVAERGLYGTFKNAVSRLASLRGVRSRGADCEIWDALTPQREGELDELWARSAGGFPSAVQRDGAYLRWKYFEHPVHRYRVYALRSGAQLSAIMIVRLDPDETVIADYAGPADDERAIASLAAEVVRDVSALGTARIKCESTHRPLLGALRCVGFVGSQYASRFRVRADAAGDPLDGWLLMSGDSDGDLLAPPSAPYSQVA
ncbi:MAG TPA: GNAT family N-acetyltransferase [Kofleriaceae bacterium]